mgnify:CR=1 FL=1
MVLKLQEKLRVHTGSTILLPFRQKTPRTKNGHQSRHIYNILKGSQNHRKLGNFLIDSKPFLCYILNIDMIKLSDNALLRLRELRKKNNKRFVRLDIKGGGCAGFQYETSACLDYHHFLEIDRLHRYQIW